MSFGHNQSRRDFLFLFIGYEIAAASMNARIQDLSIEYIIEHCYDKLNTRLSCIKKPLLYTHEKEYVITAINMFLSNLRK